MMLGNHDGRVTTMMGGGPLGWENRSDDRMSPRMKRG